MPCGTCPGFKKLHCNVMKTCQTISRKDMQRIWKQKASIKFNATINTNFFSVMKLTVLCNCPSMNELFNCFYVLKIC